MLEMSQPLPGPLGQRYREYTRQRQYGTGDILLDNRIIFFGCAGSNVYEPVITDMTANVVIQQMLYLQYENKSQEIHRSEEHTSELQSRQYLVCRLLLEKKKKKHKTS